MAAKQTQKLILVSLAITIANALLVIGLASLVKPRCVCDCNMKLYPMGEENVGD